MSITTESMQSYSVTEQGSLTARFGDLGALLVPHEEFARAEDELVGRTTGNAPIRSMVNMELPADHSEHRAAAELKFAQTVLSGMPDSELAAVASGHLAEMRHLAENPKLTEWAAAQAKLSLGYVDGAAQPGKHHLPE